MGIDPSITNTAIVAVSAEGQILEQTEILLHPKIKNQKKRRAHYIFVLASGMLSKLHDLGIECAVVAREAPLYSGNVSAQTAAGFIQGIIDAATGRSLVGILDDEDWYEIPVKSWRSIVLGTQALSYTGQLKKTHPMEYVREVGGLLKKHSAVHEISVKSIASTDVMDAYCIALAARQIHYVRNNARLLLGLPSVTQAALINSTKRIYKGIAPSRLDEATDSDLQQILRKF